MGELLVFVDDDNLLAPDFLEQTEAILARSENRLRPIEVTPGLF